MTTTAFMPLAARCPAIEWLLLSGDFGHISLCVTGNMIYS
jgi:hypothetical protein